ncbi:hypothetical protein [Pseudofrankia sp. BMG5.37]|uniref:hypothetical protein n=1 Tax=Pseudofrankia sp. BMG5.37 TaxID=3050035 RepID=UPI0037C6C65E
MAAVAAAVRDKRGHVRCALVTTAPMSRADDEWIAATAAVTTRVARGLGDRLGQGAYLVAIKVMVQAP